MSPLARSFSPVDWFSCGRLATRHSPHADAGKSFESRRPGASRRTTLILSETISRVNVFAIGDAGAMLNRWRLRDNQPKNTPTIHTTHTAVAFSRHRHSPHPAALTHQIRDHPPGVALLDVLDRKPGQFGSTQRAAEQHRQDGHGGGRVGVTLRDRVAANRKCAHLRAAVFVVSCALMRLCHGQHD